MRRLGKRILAGIAACCMVCTTMPEIPVWADAEGTTYYVDQDGGNDDASGTSEAEAWSSLDKINSVTFQPGDRILFQKGDVWTGQLSPKGSGEEGNPIVIGAYGEGDERPRIDGNNWCGEDGDDLENRIFNSAVYFYNQEYWEITSLEVTNRIPGDNPDDHIKKYGILIMGEDAGTLRHMYCQNLYVHDVVSHPIGQQAGIGRGGIIYIIRGNQVPTNWDDIVVENNYVGPNINHYGINFLSTWGSSQFQHESGIPDSEYAGQRVNSTNLVIRNNYCKDIGNAAICPSAYSNALIEHNTCDGCNSGPNGNVPVWWENGDCTVVQFNEVFGSGASSSKEDSQAFDADVNAKLNYIQYNYTHDNPSGAFFECALGTKYTTYIRYNISENDGWGTNVYGGGAIVTLGGYSSGSGNKMYVYNNDFYLSEGHDSYITNNWDQQQLNDADFQFKNNIIYSDAQSKGWSEWFKGSVDNNAYGGTDQNIRRADDENALEVKASDFEDLGTAGAGVDGFKLKETSGCIGTGALIPDNGGLDYFGNPVSSDGYPNVGADNSFAEIGAQNAGIDFEDRPEEETALTGSYADCDFREGWLTAQTGSSKELYGDGQSTVYKISLPDNKTLKSFQAHCSGSALVKIGGNGYEKTFNITTLKNTYELQIPSAIKEMTVTVNSPKGSSDVKFDNLVLEDAEYARYNLALNQPAYSDGNDQYSPSCGNDGDEGTMWVHAGDDLDGYWFVDLGQDYDLSDFELVFEQDEENAWGYTIEAARDGEEYFEEQPIYDASENTDGSRVQTGSFEPGTSYRFILIRLTKFPGDDYWPGFAEFKVYERDNSELDKSALTDLILKVKYMQQGNYTDESWQNLMNALEQAKADFNAAVTPEQVDAAIYTLQAAVDSLDEHTDGNLALNKPVTSSAEEYAPASNGNDGSTDTLWIVNGDAVEDLLPQWWQVDLGSEFVLSNYQLDFEKDEAEGFWQYRIEGSKDGENFDVLEDKTESESGIRTETGTLTSAESYRYVRVVLTGFPEYDGADYWPAFAEFQVFGQEPAEPEVDKELLKAKVEGAKALNPDKYTEESYGVLLDKITEAEAVIEDDEAAQELVDQKCDELQALIDALEVKVIEQVKKDRLAAMAAGCREADPELYTEESFRNLTDVLAQASEALEETWYTQEMVDNISALLEEAVNGLVPTEEVSAEDTARDLAKMRLAQAAALDTTLYSEESLEKIALQSKALSDALENPELTAEEINSLTAQLTAALSELTDKEEPAEVDREKLNAKIIEAKAIEQGDFTDESYGNLQNAIIAAEGVYADENATQEQIDEQVELLKNAISALEKKPAEKPDDPDDPKDPEKPSDPEDPHKPGTTPTTPTTPGDNGSDKPKPPAKPSGSGQGNKNTGTNNNGSGAKGTSGGSSVKSPKTKDEARTGMFAGLFAVSAAGIIVLEMKKKRSRR